MGAQPYLLGVFKIYLHRSSSSAPHLHRNLYLHLHQACQRGRHLLRLDMAVLKAFCLQASILLNSKGFPHRVLRHLRGLVLHLDLGCLLAKALRPECLLDFHSQVLEGLDRNERLEEHRSSKREGKERIQEGFERQH